MKLKRKKKEEKKVKNKRNIILIYGKKIKRSCCGVFLYRKKKVVWFPKFSLK
jgi:hypothetical protein